MLETTPRIKEFPKDGETWRVDWFGAVERNDNVPSEPRIQVIISPLVSADVKLSSAKAVDSSKQRHIKIGVGQLPFVSIGSLWKDGRCLSRRAGDVEALKDLLIDSSTVRLFPSGMLLNGSPLIPLRFHKLGRFGLPAKCLAIERDGDPFGVIIPVAEVIRFYYATSTDLAHAVFAGSFKHALDSVVNPEGTRFDEYERKCYVKLRKKFSDQDGWVIGRIISSPQAKQGAAMIHDSVMRDSANRPSGLYPETWFPFSGSSSLRVKAKKIQSGGLWRTLVFAIEHCTGPFPFEYLYVDRDNNNRMARSQTEVSEGEKRESFSIGNDDFDESLLEELEVQSEHEPSRYNSTLRVSALNNRFGALAEIEREIASGKSEDQHRNTGLSISEVARPEDLGTGEGNYAKSSTGALQFNTEMILARPLSNRLRMFVEAVMELDRMEEVAASIRPPTEKTELVPLTKPEKLRQWSYFDSKEKFRRRVVVADVIYDGQQSALVEFDWRSGEYYKLAILKLPYSEPITDLVLQKILMALAIRKGRWENIKRLPGGIQILTMKHTCSNFEGFADSMFNRMKA